VAITVMSFYASSDKHVPPHVELLDYLELYFISDQANAPRVGDKAYLTRMPPIYFQRAGHSRTIIGLEKSVDGERALLVFDPSVPTSGFMKRIRAGKVAQNQDEVEELLGPYRRGEEYLGQWDEFELLVPNSDAIL